MTPEHTSSSRREALERVRAFLHAHGTPPDEIAEAEARDVLDLLVADRLLVPAAHHYTQSEVAEMTGMELDLARLIVDNEIRATVPHLGIVVRHFDDSHGRRQ